MFKIAQLIREAVKNLTGLSPALVICEVARVKLDANREIEEAAMGQNFSISVYEAYHAQIVAAKSAIEILYPNGGLLIDIHGQTHTNQLIELVLSC